MTLTVITPGSFTAPGLPDLGALGFSDTFSRGDATTLGRTEAPRRQWQVSPSGLAIGEISGGEAFIQRTTSVGPAYATVDAHTSDFTLEVTLASIGSGSQREFGPTFRNSGTRDMWRFYARDGNRYRLAKYVDGIDMVLWNSTGITPTNGDRLKVVANGPVITCHVNDQQVHQVTDTFNQSATRCGWYNNSMESTDRVDNFIVTPL